MKIEFDVDIDQLVQTSTDYCTQLQKGDMKFSPVTDTNMIVKLINTGRMEYKPFN